MITDKLKIILPVLLLMVGVLISTFTSGTNRVLGFVLLILGVALLIFVRVRGAKDKKKQFMEWLLVISVFFLGLSLGDLWIKSSEIANIFLALGLVGILFVLPFSYLKK